MWTSIGKQIINLDQVSRIELAKGYLYLYGKDQGAARPGSGRTVSLRARD